jgi:hypothetical protein
MFLPEKDFWLSSCPLVSLSSVRFLGKCSDFFYWFVNSHLKRVEFNPNFPVLEFLALFYKYTFKQVYTITAYSGLFVRLTFLFSEFYGKKIFCMKRILPGASQVHVHAKMTTGPTNKKKKMIDIFFTCM